ncbi:MAG: alcohol dehydrogenase catalytic domain-containing protein [Prolixibacteraceae bacterium]|nr:alcohol dehydrogenase catalytic domain-containing protein [Prolixibacteraceae bacterium]
MKTLVLTGIRKMEMTDHPKPILKNADDVLIRIKTVGVCGSDIHYFTEGKIGTQVVEFPFAVGHECSGIIEEVGSSVTRVKPGDLVAVDPSIHCGTCDQCLAGRPHTCRKNRFLGCPGQIDGCLTEYIVMPEFTCFTLSPKFNPTTAALIEPLTIGTYSVELAQTDFRNKTVGIFGAGPIGLSVLMVLKTMDTAKILSFEPLEYRREKAQSLGANYVFNPFEVSPAEVTHEVEPLLLDVVFDCSGEQQAIDDAVRIIKPGGKLILVGIPPEGKYTINMDILRRNEISIHNVRRQNHCVEKSIRLVEEGLPVDQMVTHHFTPEETQKAFEMVSGYQNGVIKAMINFS